MENSRYWGQTQEDVIEALKEAVQELEDSNAQLQKRIEKLENLLSEYDDLKATVYSLNKN